MGIINESRDEASPEHLIHFQVYYFYCEKEGVSAIRFGEHDLTSGFLWEILLSDGLLCYFMIPISLFSSFCFRVARLVFLFNTLALSYRLFVMSNFNTLLYRRVFK